MKASNSKITMSLLGRLWEQYSARVPHARRYADLVKAKGGKIVFDHLAFRTLNIHTGEQPEGISAGSLLIRALGYRKSETYRFQKLKLTASCFEHPDPALPRIVVSQLELSAFPEWAQVLVREVVSDSPYLISVEGIGLLNLLQTEGSLPAEAAEVLVNELTGFFSRPWRVPPRETILKLNDISQYAAWTLLHGNSVSHCAFSVNFQEVKDWPDIETTCDALREAGVQFEKEIPGEKGSLLRQAVTPAVKEETEVIDDDGMTGSIEWTYAYFELTERGYTEENGERKLFTGFVGDQAVRLFDLTRTRDN